MIYYMCIHYHVYGNMSTSFHTNTSPIAASRVHSQYLFEDLLVGVVFGVVKNMVSPDDFQSYALKTRGIFTEFLYVYVEKTFTKKDALRLRAAVQYGDNGLFSKFPDLQKKYIQGTQAFLKGFQNTQE
jgi:hypothetical protein